jgi:hypothetical protein
MCIVHRYQGFGSRPLSRARLRQEGAGSQTLGARPQGKLASQQSCVPSSFIVHDSPSGYNLLRITKLQPAT